MKRDLFSLIRAAFTIKGISDKNAQLIRAAKDGNIIAAQTIVIDGGHLG